MSRRYSDEQKIKYLTEEEFNSLLKVIEDTKGTKQGRYWLRDKLLFLVAFECGLRAGELGLLKRDDFNELKNELYCKRLKGSKNNTIRLTKDTAVLLKKYLREVDDNDYIFMNMQNNPIDTFNVGKIAKKYFKLTNISKDKWHFHVVKHSCGIHLAEMGLDIKDIQYLMGHREIQNTLIYLDYTTKQQERMYKILGR